MAQGYRHRPLEETEHFVEGWYRTGDLGALDDEDMLHILGRAATSAQAAVMPVDLQETLCRLASVQYAVLVADPDPGVLVAAVEAWPGGVVDIKQCRAAVAERHGQVAAAALHFLPVAEMPADRAGQAEPARSSRRRARHRPAWSEARRSGAPAGRQRPRAAQRPELLVRFALPARDQQ